MRTTQIEAQRAKAHRQMIVDDGVTKRGENPPPGHIEALDDADGVDQIEAIRSSHAEGRGPPDHAGGKGGT